jgi:phosphoserine phosphatase
LNEEDIALITRIVLVRHGESNFNTAGLVQGRGNLDQPEKQSVLNAIGRSQAESTGLALSDLSFTAAYCSPLVRAQQTATLVLAAATNPPPLQPHAGLYEINLPDWESLTFEQVKALFPDAYDKWQNAPDQMIMGDRYPVHDLFAQGKAFWQEILRQHQGETILLVGHSGINRALISTALGLQPSEYHNLQQSNCAISVLNFSVNSDDLKVSQELEFNAQLESLNLTSHLSALTGSVLPAIRKGHMGPRILLVRHGETEWNRQSRFQGQIDVPLNPKGQDQARCAAEFLQSVHIDRAFTSPMLRPKETAEKILSKHPDLELEYIDELKEISHGLWEGKFEHEIEAEFPGELLRWQQTPGAVQMPEGENLQQVWDRVAIAWQQMVDSIAPGATALVVAHDAVNKAILCQVFNLEPESFWLFKQGNGGVSVIDYHKGGDRPPCLQAMNITTHLSGCVLDVTAAGAL